MNNSAHQMNRLGDDLAAVVGTDWVSRENNSLIVLPRTAEEVAAILQKANRAGTPVRPKGGGTGWWSSTLPPEGGPSPIDPHERGDCGG